jgi:RNA-binding protein
MAASPPPVPKLRDLKAAAQRLRPLLWIGKAGVTREFLAALDGALTRQELVKIKFEDFKDQKKTLAPQIAEQTASRLVLRVGNVAVYYRPRPADTSSFANP